MKSERYFQDPRCLREALEQYTALTKRWGWPIGESKLNLYRRAAVAFDSNIDEATRKANHENVYRPLRKYWGVGRKGMLWDQEKTFDMLTRQCQGCSRNSGLTLASFGDEHGQRTVVDCLESMRGLKVLRSGNYPIMAVSKNLHFFNPRLWVIYDTEIVFKKVYGVFGKDWNSFYGKIVVDSQDGGIRFYLAYLLWASHIVQNAYEGFMKDFADWFERAVKEEGKNIKDFRDELEQVYAAVFEFITIGAAHMEKAVGPCS